MPGIVGGLKAQENPKKVIFGRAIRAQKSLLFFPRVLREERTLIVR